MLGKYGQGYHDINGKEMYNIRKKLIVDSQDQSNTKLRILSYRKVVSLSDKPLSSRNVYICGPQMYKMAGYPIKVVWDTSIL